MQIEHPGQPVILIADRDQNVRELQQYFLSIAGFSVEFADDGQTALERVQQSPPTLVITEILLPRLDGLALCRLIRQEERTRRVPVMVFSILAAQARADEAGANAFLRKPLVESVFVPAVRDLIATPLTDVLEKTWASK